MNNSECNDTIYIDSKSYLPLMMKQESTVKYSHTGTETREYQYEYEISIGTVEELPQINLDGYEEIEY